MKCHTGVLSSFYNGLHRKTPPERGIFFRLQVSMKEKGFHQLKYMKGQQDICQFRSGAHNPDRATSMSSCLTAFSWTSLFLEGFWRKFFISFKFHKLVSKTYRPKNDIFLHFNNVQFSFLISYTSNALRDMVEILCSREKVP